MTEHDLLSDIVSATVVAYLAGGGDLGPIQPAIDAVRAVLERADVRLTLPYRLTPARVITFKGIPIPFDALPDHSRQILED